MVTSVVWRYVHLQSRMVPWAEEMPHEHLGSPDVSNECFLSCRHHLPQHHSFEKDSSLGLFDGKWCKCIDKRSYIYIYQSFMDGLGTRSSGWISGASCAEAQETNEMNTYLTHRIHGTSPVYLPTNLPSISAIHVGKYISPMDPMEYLPACGDFVVGLRMAYHSQALSKNTSKEWTCQTTNLKCKKGKHNKTNINLLKIRDLYHLHFLPQFPCSRYFIKKKQKTKTWLDWTNVFFKKTSRELTYPTLGKGKSSTQKCHKGGDMLVSTREIPHIYHTCALFDPPQMGNLMIPAKSSAPAAAACFRCLEEQLSKSSRSACRDSWGWLGFKDLGRAKCGSKTLKYPIQF